MNFKLYKLDYFYNITIPSLGWDDTWAIKFVWESKFRFQLDYNIRYVNKL